MDKQLILIQSSHSSTENKRIQAAIKKKRVVLEKLILKTEMLQVRLDMVKQEYTVKIGSLILKDNLLDLEIIQLRNILTIMDEGLSYDDAVVKIKETYYTQDLELEREQQRLKYDEEIYLKRLELKETTPEEEIRKVWRHLISLFHPDLVQNHEEKIKREEIMKQINRAYEERDLEKLNKIQKYQTLTDETDQYTLEETLIMLENEIIEQKELYEKLRKSEWYSWEIKIKRARKRNVDLFADTERTLLNDIVAKLKVLDTLREQVKART